MKKSRQANIDAKQQQEQEQEAKALSKHKQVENNRYKKAIREAINDNQEPRSVRNLRWAALIIFLALLSIATSEFVVTEDEFNNINSNLDLIEVAYQRMIYVQQIETYVRTLLLYADGTLDFTSEEEQDTRNKLDQAILNLDKAENYLSESKIDKSKPHDNLVNGKVITLYYKEGKSVISIQYNMRNAIATMVSQAYNIYLMNLDQLTKNQTSVFFVLFNSFNDLYMSLEESAKYYVSEIIDRSQHQDKTLIVILVISIVSLTTSIFILFPVINKVNSSREEVLFLFLDIPKNTVKQLSNKCEKFLTSLQEEGENASIESEIISLADEKQVDDVNDEEESYLRRRKQAKSFKGSRVGYRKFYFKFIFGILCVQSYFIANYIKSTATLNNLEDLAIEFQYTAESEPFYAFSLNSLREMVATDDTLQILQQQASLVCQEQIKQVYELNNDLFEKHLANRDIHTSEYMDQFQNIMRKNACNYLNIQSMDVTNDECTLFAEGAVTQGLHTALVRYFESMRVLQSAYFQAVGDQQKRDEILRSDVFAEILEMQEVYVHLGFTNLVKDMKNGIDDNFNNQLQIMQ